MRLENFLIDTRLEIKALEERGGGKPDQILESGAVHRQQRQVITRLSHRTRIAIKATAGSDVRLVTQYRIDIRFFGFLIKLNGTMQVPVIGQCQRIHAEVLRLIDEATNRGGTVEQTVVTVTVQMDE